MTGEPGAGRAPADALELVLALAREDPGHVLLVVGQDVDAERARGFDLGPAGRGLAGAEPDERRVEGHREERAHGQAHGRLAGGVGGDDGDAGREVAQDLAEPGLVDDRAG